MRTPRYKSTVPVYSEQPLKLYLFLLLAFSCLTLNAQQTYLKQWMYTPKRITFPASGAPTSTSLSPSATSGYYGNGIYKANGSIHFYVYGNTIYDSNSTAIFTLPFTAAINESEIAIVPFNKTLCANQYYIFYSVYNTWGSCTGCHAWLYGAIVSTNTLTGAISVSNICNTGTTTPKILAMSTSVHPNSGNAGIAVSKAIGVTSMDYGKRFLYFLSGASIQKLTLVEPSAANDYTGIGSAQTVVDSSTLNIRYQTREADLSPDGTMLAWGEFSHDVYPFTTTVNKYHIVYLNPQTGNYVSHTAINIPAYHDEFTYRVKGVEFSPDNQYLFMNSAPSQISANDGIYRMQLSNGTISVLVGSNSTSGGMLEMGSNGKLYYLKDDTLKAIDPSSFTYQPSYDIAVTRQVMLNGQNETFDNILPDQIDGENYEPYLYRKYDVSASLYEVTTNTTWNPAAWGTNLIRFPAGVKIKTGVTLTIRDMQVEFAPNTSLEIEPGGHLIVRQSILRGYRNFCTGGTIGMWQGIKGSSTNPTSPIEVNLFTETDTSFKTTVMDALNGCKLSGREINFLCGKVLYTGNVVDLRFDSMALKRSADRGISIRESNFAADLPLLDQTKGNSNGYLDGLKRTQTCIVLNLVDSTPALLGLNTFTGGQLALVSTTSTFVFDTSTFSGQRTQAVYVTKSKDTIQMRANYFKSTPTGISILDSKPGTYVQIKGGSGMFFDFEGIGFGVDCRRNRGTTIDINGCAFNLSSLAPINLFDNGDYTAALLVPPFTGEKGNRIYINNNEFDHLLSGKAAIVIGEPKGGDRKYLVFQVNNNLMGLNSNGISAGIELTNVIGGNPTKKASSGAIGPVKEGYLSGNYPVCEVKANRVELGPNPIMRMTAIAANASSRLTIFNNLVSTYNDYYFGAYGATGISISNSPGSLILGNYCSMGNGRAGLEASGSMVYSNYDCNYFGECSNGIWLNNKHMFRVYGEKHGILSTDARNNIIQPPAWGTGIYLAYWASGNNQWVFKTGNVPKIKTAYGAGSIVAGYGTDNCDGPLFPSPPSGSFTSIDTLSDPVLNFWDQYYLQRAYLKSEATYPSSNSDIVKIVKAEDSLAVDNYSAAQTIVNTIGNSSTIVSDYKKVYSILISSRLADTALTQAQVNTLDSIARKNPVNYSPASNCARVILWNERDSIYMDSLDFVYPNMAGYIDSACATRIGVPVRILNQSGVTVAEAYTDSTGSFLFDATTITPFDNGQNYRVKASIPGYPDQYTSYATILNLAYSSNIIFGCGIASPTVYQNKTGSAHQKAIDLVDKEATGVIDKSQTSIPNKFKVYPNPAHDFITIQCTTETNQVQICNVIGETVYKGSISQNARIDTRNWQKGIYFVYISDNQDNHAIEKVIIH